MAAQGVFVMRLRVWLELLPQRYRTRPVLLSFHTQVYLEI